MGQLKFQNNLFPNIEVIDKKIYFSFFQNPLLKQAINHTTHPLTKGEVDRNQSEFTKRRFFPVMETDVDVD